MAVDVSVIVLSYHPVKEKFLRTLNSAVLQKNCNFEIIIADDGSPDFYREDIENFMKQRGFDTYRIIAHEQNQGTVKNLLDAVSAAEGKYVKPISPGDYLYDEDSLSQAVSFMEEKNAKAAYGDMVYYSYDESKLRIFPKKTPVDDGMYTSQYSAGKAAKHQMIYNDYISGAAVFFERDYYESGLRMICDHVIYVEDTILQLTALQGERIYRIPRYLVWYEYGTGISTNGMLGFSERMARDFLRFYQLLYNKDRTLPFVKRAYHTWKLMLDGSAILNLVRKSVEIDKHVFRLRKSKLLQQLVLADVKESGFWNICRIE